MKLVPAWTVAETERYADGSIHTKHLCDRPHKGWVLIDVTTTKSGWKVGGRYVDPLTPVLVES